MHAGMPLLSHAEQQEAADRIHQLMEQGMSSGKPLLALRRKFVRSIRALRLRYCSMTMMKTSSMMPHRRRRGMTMLKKTKTIDVIGAA